MFVKKLSIPFLVLWNGSYMFCMGHVLPKFPGPSRNVALSSYIVKITNNFITNFSLHWTEWENQTLSFLYFHLRDAFSFRGHGCTCYCQSDIRAFIAIYAKNIIDQLFSWIHRHDKRNPPPKTPYISNIFIGSIGESLTDITSNIFFELPVHSVIRRFIKTPNTKTVIFSQTHSSYSWSGGTDLSPSTLLKPSKFWSFTWTCCRMS